MKLFTRQIMANEAAAKWEKQYPQPSGKFAKIQAEIVALGQAPDPDDVDAVIGNNSWTTLRPCDECGDDVSAVVRLGEEPDYESSTANICQKCLTAALELLYGNPADIEKPDYARGVSPLSTDGADRQ